MGTNLFMKKEPRMFDCFASGQNHLTQRVLFLFLR
jgi:hypothetical protein